MTIKKIYSLTDVVDGILCELKNGGRYARNSSDYYVIAEDNNGNTLSISVTLEHGQEDKAGCSYSDEWYSIYVVDEITGAQCESQTTETTNRTELLYELVSILYEAMGVIIK